MVLDARTLPRRGPNHPHPKVPGQEAPPGLRQGERIDTGPSMRARVRVLVVTAFMFALPVLFLGVLRADDAEVAARQFLALNGLAERFHQLELAVERSRAALVRFEAQPEIETEQALMAALDDTSRAILDLGDVRGMADGGRRLGELKTTTRRVRLAVDEAVRRRTGVVDATSLRRAHLALETLSKSAAAFGDEARALTRARAIEAQDLVSHAGRDQLVLTILLSLTALLLGGFGPAWALGPLMRLRQVTRRLDSGQKVRDIVATGDDEVAELSRSLKSALHHLEELERQRSAKVFELQAVIHGLLDRLSEPVFIIADDRRIGYVSQPAGQLTGKKLHNLRGERFDEVMFSRELNDTVDKAFRGDVPEKAVPVTIESEDGRVMSLQARVGVVTERETGAVARVVVVLNP